MRKLFFFTVILAAIGLLVAATRIQTVDWFYQGTSIPRGLEL
jgi:carbonic anhydrase